MLSPGKFHRFVPREREANLRMRLRVLRLCLKSARYRAAIREACRQDILFYINLFVWQFNPLKKDRSERVSPFISWDFQDAALLARPESPMSGGPKEMRWRYDKGILWCYENDKTCVVEKSRTMGATWIFLLVQDWLGHFHDYIQLLNISRSEAMVDSPSPNSLFWKLRFVHEKLPEWLTGKVKEQNNFFEYPNTKTFITGEASTGRAGVGGRASVIFVDEFSQIKEDREVRERTASTADCRFFNGTHVGLDSEFYRLTRTSEITKLVMHWTQHPEFSKGCYRANSKGLPEPLDKRFKYPADFRFVLDGSPFGGPHPGIRSPWYDWKCVDIGTSRGVAQDLDINPEASVSQFFEAPLILGLMASCFPPLWQGEAIIEPEDKKRIRKLEEKPGGLLKLWSYLEGGLPHPSAFCIGADIAHGTGATPSCLSILDATRGVKVGSYEDSLIKPDRFAELAVGLCNLFKNAAGMPAFLIWEDAGPSGSLFKARVLELGFRNFYYRENVDQPFRKNSQDTPGWYPTDKTKVSLLTEYQKALASGDFVSFHEEALEECLKFKWEDNGRTVTHPEEKNSDPSGAGVNHGDHVIADALACKIGKGKSTKTLARDKLLVPPSGLAWRREQRKKQKSDKDAAWQN